MPSRKFHHKSSTGCQECKQQRVKCDETHPVCNRCVRQTRTCSYLRGGLPPSASNSAVKSSANAASSSNVLTPQTSHAGSLGGSPKTVNSEDAFGASIVVTPSSRYQDLELLHHWTLEASNTFSKNPQLTNVWQNQVVRQALKYPFLMHAIFSFSALHLVSSLSQDLAPSRDAWLKRSAYDYGLALNLARPELENINPGNCHAVFAFSSIVAISRLALPGVTGDYGEGGVLEHMLQTFHLLRGILAVLKVAYGWVKSGPLGAAMQDIDDFEPVPIEPNLKASLEALELRVTKNIEDAEERMAYFEALHRLRLYFSHPPGGGAAIHSAAAWPVLLQAEYMDDLTKRKPLALAILGYYAVILEEQKEKWWVVDQGKRLLISVMEALEPHGVDEWLPLIVSAQQRVKPESLNIILRFKVPKSLEQQDSGMITG